MSTTVVYHRADFDGLFSAAVCKKFLPDAQFIGWDFGDPLIPFPGEGTLYIVDLSPDCLSDAQVAIAAHSHRLTWIDHHKSSIEKWSESIPGYRIDGVAACRLCYQWFTNRNAEPENGQTGVPPKEWYVERRLGEPLALILAGEYDIWDLHDPRALPFQFGLTAFEPNSKYEPLIDILVDDFEAECLVERGRAALAWQRAFASQVMRERSYRRDWEGLRFAILGSAHTRNSMWFPEAEIEPEVDALMCWRYDGEKVAFSLYHAPGHEQHDLSQIAVKYGGGGHRGACGFMLPLDEALEVIR